MNLDYANSDIMWPLTGQSLGMECVIQFLKNNNNKKLILQTFSSVNKHVLDKFVWLLCGCVRKIGPELTSVANLSLLLEEDYCWDNICASLPLFCMWDAAIAWMDELCRSVPRIRNCEPWAAKVEHTNLTPRPLGWPQDIF